MARETPRYGWRAVGAIFQHEPKDDPHRAAPAFTLATTRPAVSRNSIARDIHRNGETIPSFDTEHPGGRNQCTLVRSSQVPDIVAPRTVSVPALSIPQALIIEVPGSATVKSAWIRPPAQ